MGTNIQFDLQRLIFTTSNSGFLRGLICLPTWLFFITCPLLGHLSMRHSKLAGFGLLVAFAVAVVSTKQLHDFYNRHYGKVTASEGSPLIIIGIGVWAIAAFGCFVIDGKYHPQFSLAAFWFASFFWGIFMHSAGHRWYYLVASICFVLLVPYWRELGETWQTVILAVAFIATGVMDHLLLTRLLPPIAKDQVLSAIP